MPPHADNVPERPNAKLLGLPPGFILLQELGRGGAAVVYKSWQLGMERMVALKMILAGRNADHDIVDRFQAEARAVARLQHANIVQVYEVGTFNEIPYMAMEYVAGGNLQTLLTRQSIAPLQAAAFVETLARAVHFAHQQGIIHRDLKPANILLQESGFKIPERGNASHETIQLSISHEIATSTTPNSEIKAPTVFLPKIADFGLARQLDQTQRLTPTGTVLGTPGYMAPEQAEGKSGDIGPATDIFSLGVILYEMVTRTLPFGAAIDTKSFQISLPPPSRRNPSCPPTLDDICLRCLQRAPGDRYPTALELAEDLRQLQNPLRGNKDIFQPKDKNVLPTGTGNRWLIIGPTLGIVGALLLAWFLSK